MYKLQIISSNNEIKDISCVDLSEAKFRMEKMQSIRNHQDAYKIFDENNELVWDEGRIYTREDLKHPVLQDILQKIECLAGDSFSEDVCIDATLHPEQFSDREKQLIDRIGRIYALAHSFNIEHTCFSAHEGWRGDVEVLAKIP